MSENSFYWCGSAALKCFVNAYFNEIESKELSRNLPWLDLVEIDIGEFRIIGFVN